MEKFHQTLNQRSKCKTSGGRAKVNLMPDLSSKQRWQTCLWLWSSFLQTRLHSKPVRPPSVVVVFRRGHRSVLHQQLEVLILASWILRVDWVNFHPFSVCVDFFPVCFAQILRKWFQQLHPFGSTSKAPAVPRGSTVTCTTLPCLAHSSWVSWQKCQEGYKSILSPAHNWFFCCCKWCKWHENLHSSTNPIQKWGITQNCFWFP